MSSARLRQRTRSKLLTAAAAGMMLLTLLIVLHIQRTPHAAANGVCTLDSDGLLTYLDDPEQSGEIRPILNSNGNYRVGPGCTAVDPSTVNSVLILARDGSDTILLDAVNYDLAGFPFGFSITVRSGSFPDSFRIAADMVPAAGLNIDGQGGVDTVEVIGTGDFDFFNLSPGVIRRGTGGLISFVNVEQLNVFAGGAEDIFNIDGGTADGTAIALFGQQASDQFLIDGRIASQGLFIDADDEASPNGRGNADLMIVTLSNSADGDDVYDVLGTPPSALTFLRGDGDNDTFNVVLNTLGTDGRLELIGNSPLFSDFITGGAVDPGDVANFTAGAGASGLVIDNAVLIGNDGNAGATGLFLNGETTPRAIATFMQTVNVVSSVSTQVLDTIPLIATNVTAGGLTTHYPGVAFVTVDGTTPSSGSLAGGETATIFGTNLDQVTQVKFGSKTASFTPSADGLSLTATVPQGDQFGSVKVTVARDGVSSFPIDSEDEFGLGFSIGSPFSPPTPSDTHTYLNSNGAPFIDIGTLPAGTLDPLQIIDADGNGTIDSNDTSIDGRTLDEIAQAILDATIIGGGSTLDVLVSIDGGPQLSPSAVTIPVGGPFTLTWVVRANTVPPQFSQSLSQTVTVLAADGDEDGDGLTNGEEAAFGSDPTNACSPLDVNGDNAINLSDVLFMVARLSLTDPTLDFDQSGVVDLSDVLAVVGALGTTCS
jgi:hypothetical protein